MRLEVPKTGTEQPHKVAVWAGPALIAATAAVMTWWTWGKWVDPIVDFGRELYFPWQIINGKVLYRDMASLFGPLSPYFNAAMFRLFGVSLLTLVLVNLALLGVLLALLYAILKRIGSRFGATVACLFVLLLFAFARYIGMANFNFVCPYTHSATHGLILGVAAVYFMARYHERPSAVWTSSAGLALGLAFLTKPEMFAGAAPAVAAGFLLAAWAHRFTAARLARAAVNLIGMAALPLLAAWALFCLAMPSHEALHGVLGSWCYLFNSRITHFPLYRSGMGTDDVAGSLRIMLRSATGYAELLIPGAILALACRRPGPYRYVLVAVLLVASGILVWQNFTKVYWDYARAWPLFMVLLAAVALARFIRNRRAPDRGAREALIVTAAVFGLALLSKILLNSRVHDYGFVLALPSGVLMILALVDWAPRALDRMGGFGNGFRALALALIVVSTYGHVRLTGRNLSFCIDKVGSGADAFAALPQEGAAASLALKMIDANIGRSETLAVLPEGVIINYLSRRPNPTPYTTYLGVELEAFGDENMTESYERHPPDYVLLVHRSTWEYGLPFFGTDFGKQLYRWIMSRYRPLGQIGKMPLQRKEDFGMLLLRRDENSGDFK